MEKEISQMESPVWSSLSVVMQSAEGCSAAPATVQRGAAGGSVRSGLGVTEHGNIREVTVVHQRGPEAEQEGSKSLVKALPEERRVLTTVMWQVLHVCSKEKEKRNLVNQIN